jgi:hypothetical protein
MEARLAMARLEHRSYLPGQMSLDFASDGLEDRFRASLSSMEVRTGSSTT